MIRLRWIVGVIGLVALTAGTASAYDETPKPSVEKANGPADGVDRHVVTPVVPYSHACQTKEYAPTCIGRIANWWTYQPDCSCAPCETKYTSSCYPPLFTYFTTSPFNRCYKPYECSECENTGWFKGLWCGRCRTHKNCGTETACGTSCCSKGPWSISITFPSISFSRCGDACESCPAPKCEKACPAPKCERACVTPRCDTCPTDKNYCMALPRKVSPVACENSSAGCHDKCDGASCEAPCHPRLFSGRLLGFFSTGCGAGSCGVETCCDAPCRPRLLGGRLLGCCTTGSGIGGCGSCGYGKQCGNTPVHSPVDLEHMPIVAPQNIIGAKPGSLSPKTVNADPTPAPTPAPPAASTEPLAAPLPAIVPAVVPAPGK
jgi:hypothetical protein